MVRLSMVAAVLLAGACAGSPYDQPIRLTPQGDAVRANMAAQVINPTPPRHANVLTDGAVALRTYQAYQDGEVEDIREVKTQESVLELEEE